MHLVLGPLCTELEEPSWNQENDYNELQYDAQIFEEMLVGDVTGHQTYADNSSGAQEPKSIEFSQ